MTQTSLQSSDISQDQQRKSSSLGKILKYVCVTALFFTSVGVLAYYMLVINNPVFALGKVLKNVENLNSISLKFVSFDNKTIINTDLHFNNSVSLLEFEESISGSSSKEKLKAKIAFDKESVYILPSYSRMDDVISLISMYLPNIEATRTYAKAIPILQGREWLHVPLSNPLPAINLPIPNTKESLFFMNALRKAIVFRAFDRNYSFEGTHYSRIVLGFHKQYLLEFLDIVEQTFSSEEHAEIITQLQALRNIVEETENWDQDLVQLFIKDDRLAIVSLAIPEMSEEVLTNNTVRIFEGKYPELKETYQNFFKMLFSTVKPTRDHAIDLGTIYVSNYNSAPDMKTPQNVVEGIELYVIAEQELAPLIQEQFAAAERPSRNYNFEDPTVEFPQYTDPVKP